jgi:Fur family ferric uptake transcriptional regulator
VYRTLPLLTASGLVHEMDFGRDFKFYDPNYAEHPDHNHIICQDCNSIVEFESDKIKKVEGEMCQKLGFSVKTHRLQITGTCDQFRRLGKCPRKKS